MDRRTRSLLVAVLAILIVVTAGVAVLLGASSSNGSANAPTATGVIVAVQSEGLDKVRGFSLRLPDGSIEPFTIGTLENGATFPPGHLVEHQATAQPVRVWYRIEGATRVAIRLEDAS